MIEVEFLILFWGLGNENVEYFIVRKWYNK